MLNNATPEDRVTQQTHFAHRNCKLDAWSLFVLNFTSGPSVDRTSLNDRQKIDTLLKGKGTRSPLAPVFFSLTRTRAICEMEILLIEMLTTRCPITLVDWKSFFPPTEIVLESLSDIRDLKPFRVHREVAQAGKKTGSFSNTKSPDDKCPVWLPSVLENDLCIWMYTLGRRKGRYFVGACCGEPRGNYWVLKLFWVNLQSCVFELCVM